MAALAVAEVDTNTQNRPAHARTPHLGALTGLRFMAAALVVLFHFAIYTRATTFTPFGITIPRGVPHLVANGWMGVSFFFMLSGFILAYNYLDERGAIRGRRRDFWIARFARIYPVYVLALVVAALPFFWEQQPAPAYAIKSAVASLTLMQSWIPSLATTWNGPGWSLSNEVVFYALFPFIAVYVARLARRRMYATLLTSWAMSLAVTFALSYFSMRSGSPSAGRWAMVLGFNPLVRLPEFVAGIALGCLFITRRASSAWQIGRWRLSPALLSAFALIGIVGIMSSGIVLPHGLPTYLIVDPFFALLIYSLAFSQGPLARLFSSRVMIVLGQASYAVYLLHAPLLRWVDHLTQPLVGAGQNAVLQSLGGMLLWIGLVIGLSIAVLFVVEEPARRSLTRSIRQRRAQTAIDQRFPGLT